MVNAHSHAFQRGLRGRGERVREGDDFWAWREGMYELAGSLDPAAMRSVAAEAFREMRAAGYGVVGEFHYVHHQPDGTPYEAANDMIEAVAAGAGDAGLPLVALPAAYHRGGHPRFRDASLDDFLARVDALDARHGIAAHSVRAVPEDWLREIARYSDEHGLVRHVHASEQKRELEQCQAEHGCSPIELLARTGFLGPRTSVIHATHVDDRDISLLAESGTTVVICPTTEGNLGDGFPPLHAFVQSGIRLAVGSDSQVRIDPFEECRELETLARRERHTRAAILCRTGDLWAELVDNGLHSLGVTDTLPVTIDRDHPEIRDVSDEDLALALSTCASAAVVHV
jgi:formimidoylglutamate deiminase